MASSLSTMNAHHGKGLWGFAAGTAAGGAASVALGTLYGRFRDRWWGRWMPAFFAAGGKGLALLTFLVSKGRWVTPAIIANDVGQAGVNALGLNLGVKLGLKLAKKQLVIQEETAALAPGAVRVAGELPPAAAGRSLENLSVEELANLV